MARQANTKITGTKGDLSFYKLDDTYYVRTKSYGGTQTKATKARQKDFALAVFLAAGIRSTLHSAIPNPKQKSMQNRLTQSLMQWALTKPVQQPVSPLMLEQLMGFRFIEATPLDALLNLAISIHVTGNALRVTIPAFNPKQAIKAPAGTTRIKITIAAGSCSTKKHLSPVHAHKELIISWRNKLIPQQEIVFEIIPEPGHMSLVAVSVAYLVKQDNKEGSAWIKQHRWNAGEIIYAVLH